MRPFVLAGIVAALAGCSIPYEGKKFAAVEKKSHHAAGGGEHHDVADPTDHNEQSGAAHMEAHGTDQGSGSLNGLTSHPTTNPEAIKTLGQTPTVFPSTAKPTGEATKNPTENRNAPQPQPVAEEHGHETVQGNTEHGQ